MKLCFNFNRLHQVLKLWEHQIQDFLKSQMMLNLNNWLRKKILFNIKFCFTECLIKKEIKLINSKTSKL